MLRIALYCFILLFGISSCGVQKYLPKGEQLYRGATIQLIKEGKITASSHALKKQLRLAAKPNANKFALGKPYKVWWWYTIGQPKHPKGIRTFIRNKLGEPPVFSSRVNVNVTAKNMQDFLSNLSYFHATVKGDTTNKGYLTTARYTAHVFPPYKIKNITWINEGSDLVKLLQEKQQGGILKPGNGYRLSDIQAEKDRLDLYVKRRGYFYFSPAYIMAYADSTVGNNQVDIIFSIKENIPENATHAYSINSIVVFPNYTLLLPPPDTSKKGMQYVDGLLIRDTVHKFKTELFKDAITYRPGKIYSSVDQNTTLNRLINLGVFKFAKNRYEQTFDTAGNSALNVFYYLTPAKRKSLQAEINGFSKEHSFFGTQASVTWRNRNAFKRAELLLIKGYGGLEMSFPDSFKHITNYRAGVEASVNLPRFYIPFIHIKEYNLYPPHTRLLLGYELFRKQDFYSKNIYRLQYEFVWKQGSNKEHWLSPIALTYINAGKLTDTFRKEIFYNPALLINVNSELILGSIYSFTYNTTNPFERKQWYFKGSLDVAGNVAGILKGANQPRQKKIAGIPFAQYIKADIDVRYKRRLHNNFDWINQLLIGVGIPYNNSNILPFSKQYVIGGTKTLRGFQWRKIGPGSYLPALYDQRLYQLVGGDYKLQFNSEMRIPLFAKFSGTVFLDMGNVWTKDTILFGKAGQLKKDFYKEIAVASGVGLRFDAGLFLIRADLGFPLRKPYLPEGQRWVIKKIELGDRNWRQQNLVLNIALGYPF